MRAKFFIFTLLVVVMGLASLSYSVIPPMINYQGKITTPAGALIDSSLSMVFSLYHGQGDVSPAWAETLVVPVEKGIFSVVLGNVHPIPYDIFDGAVKYLGVKAGADPEMSPRKKIVSVGYAFKSEYSDTSEYARSAPGGGCGWVDDGSVVRLETESDKVGIGTIEPEHTLHVEGEDKGIYAVVTQGSEANRPYGVKATLNTQNFAPTGGCFKGEIFKSTNAPNISCVMGGDFDMLREESETGSMIGLRVRMAYEISADRGIELQVHSPAYAIYSGFDGLNYFEGKVGIGRESPTSKLDVDGDINTSGFYKIGANRVLSAPGNYNTFVGVNAGENNTTGNNNTFLGMDAGYSNTIGTSNTFLGKDAGYLNTEGIANTFVGRYAGYFNSTGSYNTYLGYRAGYSNSTGYPNTFLGSYAGYSNLTGNYNTFVGNYAGYDNTTGERNTFLGAQTGYSNTTGNSNTFLGRGAGYANTVGKYNAFLGSKAGFCNTTGKHNIFIGHAAGYLNTTGFRNTFLGDSTGYHNETGMYNTFLGHYAGFSNTSGTFNTFLGDSAGYHNSGYNNTYLGAGAGVSNTSGHNNTFLGKRAGKSNTTGSGNVFIGHEAGFYETGSNKLYIANDEYNSDVLIYGDFSTDRVGINTTSPGYALDVNGDINVNGAYNVKKGGTNYNHPDYVFEPTYKLLPLNELREYVFEKKSLPNVISAEEVKKNEGFKMDELLIQMLEKIEEQTLYIFQLEERIAQLEKESK